MICSYVHYIDSQSSLQGPAGSFIRCDGTFREVMWQGSVGVHDCGGTQRKKRAGGTPWRWGQGQRLGAPRGTPSRAPRQPAAAAPRARHALGRHTPSLAALRRLMAALVIEHLSLQPCRSPSCSRPSSAGCPSPATHPVRALRRGPAACRLPPGLRQPLVRWCGWGWSRARGGR
jgi:hypothetical protein